ncbi:DUF4424 family protein [Maritalea porphyrae]|uniref:DUF4424 family protein n=1 Tax=Maritalea porphyrae TaxID=880732 RepID=UPI0022AEF2E4|nr:DUF4424 family protein [Maritalea porphyrae]MCZ4271626.1 DUF4424 family protein [Maritalea porphyrae]
MRRYFAFWAALFCVTAAPVAVANDSSAKISAGGIVLEKTDSVRMNSEDLYISKDLVKVHYVYENITNDTQDLTVAFPLPPIRAEDVYDTYPEFSDRTKFIDFETKVDGKLIEPREIVVIKSNDGRNVTDFFRTKGLPLAPFDDFWSFEFDNNFDDVKIITLTEDMRAEGLLIKDEKGYDRRAWTTQIYYVWQHQFEPGKQVLVDHKYTPIAGGQFFLGDVTYDGWSFKESFQKEYCASEGEWGALERIAAQTQTPLISEVGYILKTGNNWAGPIAHFRLTIDKSDPRNIVTLCWDGDLKKIAPTLFQFEAKDFVPNQDISMAVTQGWME